MDIEQRVKAIISKLTGIEAERINQGHLLRDDLDLDSMDLIQLAIEVENEFGIDIPDEDVDRPELGTVAGLVEHVAAKSRLAREAEIARWNEEIASGRAYVEVGQSVPIVRPDWRDRIA